MPNVSRTKQGKSPSRMIDERIKELGDWRGKTLSRLRALIKEVERGSGVVSRRIDLHR